MLRKDYLINHTREWKGSGENRVLKCPKGSPRNSGSGRTVTVKVSMVR